MFVCLLFIGHTTFVHFAALPPRAGEQEPSSRGRPSATGQACTARARARKPYNFSTKKSYAALMPFKNKTVRALVTAEIFKKREKRKPTCHFPSSVYSLPSPGVFTFRIVLNRILHKSSLLAPWNHGEPGDLPSLRRRG